MNENKYASRFRTERAIDELFADNLATSTMLQVFLKYHFENNSNGVAALANVKDQALRSLDQVPVDQADVLGSEKMKQAVKLRVEGFFAGIDSLSLPTAPSQG